MPSKYKLPKGLDFTFETERLIIRPIIERDKELFVNLHQDERIMTYSGGAVCERVATSKFNNALKLLNNLTFFYRTWAITDKKSKEAIGILILFTNHDENDLSTLEIGIMLTRKAQGKLLPEEAMGSLMEFAFKKLSTKRIIAEFEIKNIATKRFVTKLGFQFTSPSKASGTHSIFFDAKNWNKNLIL